MGHLVSDFITLFVVVDPLAASSVFLAVTAGYTAPAKRKIAALSVVFAFGVLMFFIVLGLIIGFTVQDVIHNARTLASLPISF